MKLITIIPASRRKRGVGPSGMAAKEASWGPASRFGVTLRTSSQIQDHFLNRRTSFLGWRPLSVLGLRSSGMLRLGGCSVFGQGMMMRDCEEGVVFPFGSYLAVKRWNVLFEPDPTLPWRRRERRNIKRERTGRSRLGVSLRPEYMRNGKTRNWGRYAAKRQISDSTWELQIRGCAERRTQS